MRIDIGERSATYRFFETKIEIPRGNRFFFSSDSEYVQIREIIEEFGFKKFVNSNERIRLYIDQGYPIIVADEGQEEMIIGFTNEIDPGIKRTLLEKMGLN